MYLHFVIKATIIDAHGFLLELTEGLTDEVVRSNDLELLSGHSIHYKENVRRLMAIVNSCTTREKETRGVTASMKSSLEIEVENCKYSHGVVRGEGT